MPTNPAGFELHADKHGRPPQVLAPSGGTLTVAIGAASAGGFLPGDRRAIKEKSRVIRVTATKDCYLEFGDGSATATSSSMIFQQGTEAMRLPDNTNYAAAMTLDGSSGALSITVME